MKAMVFLALSALAFAVVYMLVLERRAAPQPHGLPGGLELPAPAQRSDPFVFLQIPLLVGAGGAGLFYAGRHAARAMTRKVAVKIEAGRLHFHPSYTAMPASLGVEDIATAIFDRADRLPDSESHGFIKGYSGLTYGAGKLGARLRHGLYLGYRTGASAGDIRLIDNDFDGGSEQLRRFAAQLEVWRQSRVRVAGRG